MNLVIAVLAAGLAGAGCVVAGIYLLLGLPWALIVTGALLFAAAAVLRRGMTNG